MSLDNRIDPNGVPAATLRDDFTPDVLAPLSRPFTETEKASMRRVTACILEYRKMGAEVASINYLTQEERRLVLAALPTEMGT